MELSLQTYFDLGVSYGLGDSAFEPIQDRQHDPKVPDIRGIGISNPLGLGRVTQLTDATRILWRRASVDKVDVPEMELRFEGSTAEFPDAPATFEEYKFSLKSLIESHDFKTEITVYGIGIGFLRVDFHAGVPLPLANGLRRCFEYAAYLETVSNAILKEAQDFAQECLAQRGMWQRFLSWFNPSGTNIAALSKRPPPEVQTDESGYSESRLFTGFTCVALCTDKSDNIEAIKERLWARKSDDSMEAVEEFDFGYHGVIYFSWDVCLIKPKDYSKPGEPPEKQIQRMLLCIQIAHTFQGALVAFDKFFVNEARVDAEGFIRGEPGGLKYIQINRLRALVLAVIGLTKFQGVTETAEDQKYFSAYNKYAKLEEFHEHILANSEVLATVQKGESELEQERRDDWLNTAVLFLTGFTMLTVLKDIFEFLKSEDTGVGANVLHDQIATAITIMLIIVLLFLRRKVVHRRSHL